MTDPIDFDDLNRKVIDEFHVGVKSGAQRIVPLVPYQEADRIFVFASKGGADTPTGRYRNLLASPHTVAELGSETFPLTVREIHGHERDDVYAKQSEVQPEFADYERKTTRVIPVLELQRVAAEGV